MPTTSMSKAAQVHGETTTLATTTAAKTAPEIVLVSNSFIFNAF